MLMRDEVREWREETLSEIRQEVFKMRGVYPILMKTSL